MRSIVIALLLFLTVVCHASETELQVRANTHEKIQRLWKSGDLEEIERIANTYREKKMRTPSGLWMRSLVNGALRNVILDTAQREGWSAMEDKARAWATRSPNAPVAQIFLADVLLSHGFAIRGTDYAYKVPPDQTTEFKRYIRLARSQLENTKTIASVDPSWYEFMLNIAQYQSWPASQHEALFTEAVQREPHFLQTYFVGSGRFSPKWGGSRDELNAFITKAVAGLGPTQSDAMYARIHWWIAELRYFDRFEDAPVDCVRMMRGAKAVVLDYPDQWNINNFALFAVRCQDKNAFDYFAKLIQPKPMMEVWRAPAYFEGAVAWARQ